jgi:NAD(P)-dependent dehydrogenase (short-subunit alcohol dehydrogenase family)
MFTLHGRKALITGGSSGIGAATASLFARVGAEVALVGRTKSRLARVAAEIEDGGAKVILIPADLSRFESIPRIVEEAASAMDGLDVLVNNAGIYRPGRVAELQLSDWQAQFDLNVRAPFFLCKAAYPWLKKADGAVVVNVLSNLAQRPVANAAAYSASKAALQSLGETLALEWAKDDIRVVAVSPGVVDTPIHGGADLSGVAAEHPLRRIGKPEEVASAILFLACDASAWITGSNVFVDGGIHLA